MRRHALVCLAVMVCGAWALASQAQKKPGPSSQERAPLSGQTRAAAGEKDQAVARRVIEDVFSQGRYELIGELYSADCSVHHGGKTSTLQDAVAEGKGWRQAAPDLLMTVDSMTTKGNRVIVSWTAKGTNTGSGNGLRATGKHVVMHGSSAFRMANGRIAEVWNRYSRDELFRQLGVNPRVAQLFLKVQEIWSSFGRTLAGDQASAAAR